MAHDSKHKKHAPKDCKSTAVLINTDTVPDSYISEEEYAKMKYGSMQGKHKGSMMYTKKGK